MSEIISMSHFQLAMVKDEVGQSGIAMTLFDDQESWTFGLIESAATIELARELLRLSAFLPASQESERLLSEIRDELSDQQSPSY